MYPSESQNNSQVYSKANIDATLNYRIDLVCLAVLFVSFFSCLIRSDYNFPIIFLAYFIWQQRKDHLSLKIILSMCIILIFFDLLFAFTQIRVWVSDDGDNQVWQTIRPMHNFGVFCYIIIMILKIILTIFVSRGVSNMAKAVQPI